MNKRYCHREIAVWNCVIFSTPSIRVILYTVLSRRSLARIITMSKCPAQGMTMFPRRRNILLAVSKSATAASSVYLSPPYRIYTPKFTQHNKARSIFASKEAKKKVREPLCESLWSRGRAENKLRKFMQIRRESLHTDYFLNSLICSSLSDSEDGNEIHGSPKCAQNIFLSISERFLTPLTLL